MRALWSSLLLVGCAGGSYGDRCETRADCEAPMVCTGIFATEATYCLYTCTQANDFHCPDGYVCMGGRDLNDKVCLRHCTVDADCPTQFHCDANIGGLCASDGSAAEPTGDVR